MKEIAELAKWLSETHNKHRDGCKGSCGERAIGFHHSDYNETYWYAIFGGYCLGDLPRRVEVKAPTFEKLESEVKRKVLEAVQNEMDLSVVQGD